MQQTIQVHWYFPHSLSFASLYLPVCILLPLTRRGSRERERARGWKDEKWKRIAIKVRLDCKVRFNQTFNPKRVEGSEKTWLERKTIFHPFWRWIDHVKVKFCVEEENLLVNLFPGISSKKPLHLLNWLLRNSVTFNFSTSQSKTQWTLFSLFYGMKNLELGTARIRHIPCHDFTLSAVHLSSTSAIFSSCPLTYLRSSFLGTCSTRSYFFLKKEMENDRYCYFVCSSCQMIIGRKCIRLKVFTLSLTLFLTVKTLHFWIEK